MIQDGIVQDHNAGGFKSARVDGGVERVVAEVIERHIAGGGRNFNGAVAAELGQQGGGVIGDAGRRGRERRIKTDGHALILLPNKAVPMRTQVEPSSMAVSRSCDMPMESCVKPCNSPSSRRRRKISRGASGSSDQGGMVIRPVRRRLGHWRTAAINSGRSAGRAPLLASSTESLTSSMMSSGRPASSRRRAILAESTVWMAWNSSAARRVLLDCRWPMKWKRAPGRLATSGALESNSWT